MTIPISVKKNLIQNNDYYSHSKSDILLSNERTRGNIPSLTIFLCLLPRFGFIFKMHLKINEKILTHKIKILHLTYKITFHIRTINFLRTFYLTILITLNNGTHRRTKVICICSHLSFWENKNKVWNSIITQ